MNPRHLTPRYASEEQTAGSRYWEKYVDETKVTWILVAPYQDTRRFISRTFSRLELQHMKSPERIIAYYLRKARQMLKEYK